jgi:hypothetical protein
MDAFARRGPLNRPSTLAILMADHEKLRETLDQLRSQLDELRRRDPAVAEQLAATIDEARAVLTGKSPSGRESAAPHGTIVDRLKDAVLEYEASHPSLAGNLGGIIDALGRMGI